jgi:NAD(P)-dependent dehydrogenase (short-subunit alcohol dehydrogenase family)
VDGALEAVALIKAPRKERHMSDINAAADEDLPFSRVFDFSGHVVLVTGASGGIGRSTAELFRERGAKLALVDKSPKVISVAEEIGDGAGAWEADITDEAQVVRTIGEIADRFGRIDVLINSAGIGGVWPAETIKGADWSRVISVNLTGQFLVTREVARRMLAAGRGRIVILASQAALVGLENHAAYGASKAGLLGMLRTMAVEWGPHGVTINAISPTVVDTDMSRAFWSGEKGDRARAEIPLRRFAQPREIAYAAMYLASDAAAMITGTNLVIDGGRTIR